MGIRKMIPGPLAPINRPKRNITPLSYSRRIRIALAKNSRNNTRKVAKKGILGSFQIINFF